MKLVKLLSVTVLSLFVTATAMARDFENGAYRLAELDSQFPYKHTPDIFRGGYGPWGIYTLKVTGDTFQLIEEDPDGESAYPEYLRVFEGPLSRRVNSRGETLLMGVVKTAGFKKSSFGNGPYTGFSGVNEQGLALSNKTKKYYDPRAGAVLSFSLKMNGTPLQRFMRYRAWNVRNYTEGTLAIYYRADRNGERTKNAKVQVSDRISLEGFEKDFEADPRSVLPLK